MVEEEYGFARMLHQESLESTCLSLLATPMKNAYKSNCPKGLKPVNDVISAAVDCTTFHLVVRSWHYDDQVPKYVTKWESILQTRMKSRYLIEWTHSDNQAFTLVEDYMP